MKRSTFLKSLASIPIVGGLAGLANLNPTKTKVWTRDDIKVGLLTTENNKTTFKEYTLVHDIFKLHAGDVAYYYKKTKMSNPTPILTRTVNVKCDNNNTIRLIETDTKIYATSPLT